MVKPVGIGPAASAPSWPLLVLGTLALVATASLAQGFVDVVIPIARGEAPFGFLFAQTERFGPAFFVGYVFLHNLGLACVVPGYGFVAARFERCPRNRFLIGLILAGGVAVSLLVALEFLIQAGERFDLPVALGIYAVEAVAVLAVALSAAGQLRGFVPTRRYAWALVTPLRRLRVPLGVATTVLLAVSLVEASIVLAG